MWIAAPESTRGGPPATAGRGSHLRANSDIPYKPVLLTVHHARLQGEGSFANVAFKSTAPSVHERQAYTGQECWLSVRKQFKG